MEKELNIKVCQNDLAKIGNTMSQENGFVSIVCDGNIANLEEIFLRNILLCFGDEYTIIDSEDFWWNDNKCDIVFHTNLPWSAIYPLL